MRTQLATDPIVKHILALRCKESGGFTYYSDKKKRTAFFTTYFPGIATSPIADLALYTVSNN